jgi:GT2 family glycosyltransferase
MTQPLVSFVVATFNRGPVLVDCLRHTMQCGLAEEAFEIIVVDNASTDGTPELLDALPLVKLIRLNKNEGPVAKNHALRQARGEFIVLLDDDAFALPGATTAMLEHFRNDPALGAAVFDVMLPDGTREGSAYPDVFIGAGTALRKEVLERVGLLPAEYFMQAEEYDLSFRILAAGFSIRRFADMPLRHLKTPGARVTQRTTRLDVRNNLYLLAKYVPAPLCFSLAADWLARYWMMARMRDAELPGGEHQRAYLAGAAEGLARWSAQRKRGRRLKPAALETIFKFQQIQDCLAGAQRRHRLQRIILADFGKNMLAYFRAANRLGIQIVAICDDQLGGPGKEYRGVPIRRFLEVADLAVDAWVSSNMSPTQAPRRVAQLRNCVRSPVIDLFEDP